MKILITGSKGVIGSKLRSKLEENGHTVFGLDLFNTNENYIHDLGKIKNENYFRCDISEYRELEYIIKYFNPDLVYNCAAEFGRWNGEHFYEKVWKSNAIGTKNVIRLQEKCRFKLIHCSSSEVYGDYSGVMYESIMLDFPIRQMNDYAMSKWVNEMQINNSCTQYGTKTVIVRLFNTYGPGEWYHPFRSVNCVFCYNLLHNKPITVYRGHLRTSTYIDDAIETFSKIADDFRCGEVYNITSDKQHSIEELAEYVIKYTGASRSLVNYKNSEMLTTTKKLTSAMKIKTHFDHKNTVELEEGVRKTVDWMKEYYKLGNNRYAKT